MIDKLIWSFLEEIGFEKVQFANDKLTFSTPHYVNIALVNSFGRSGIINIKTHVLEVTLFTCMGCINREFDLNDPNSLNKVKTFLFTK